MELPAIRPVHPTIRPAGQLPTATAQLLKPFLRDVTACLIVSYVTAQTFQAESPESLV
jgi:hypothetical protein